MYDKFSGCGLNFHKRCVIKVPNNCSSTNLQNGKRRRSSTLNVPRSPSETGSTSSLLTSASEELGLPSSTSLFVPKQSRSPSLGSRTGWFEKDAGAGTRIKIPHTFVLHSYTRPTICGFCKKLLKGLFKQGLQCKDCQYNAHKKCIEKIPKDCPGENLKDPANDYPDSGLGSEPEREHSRDEAGDEDSDNESSSPSDSRKPTIVEPNSVFNGSKLGDGLSGNEEDEPGKSRTATSPCNNIPLMRIVQSVKHTKRRGSKVLKEGWMVHFTNKDKTVKRHYWRLDTKAITLFQSDTGSKYYKEIPLAEILVVDTARNAIGDVMHCFELLTANMDYYVGEDPTYGKKGTAIPIPPPESGIGAHLAKTWENTIRQALMPVQTTNSKGKYCHI